MAMKPLNSEEKAKERTTDKFQYVAMNPQRDSEEKAKEKTAELTGPDKFLSSSEMKSHTAAATSDSTKNSYY